MFIIHRIHIAQVDAGKRHVFDDPATDPEPGSFDQMDIIDLPRDTPGLHFYRTFFLPFIREQRPVDDGHGGSRVDDHFPLYAVDFHFDDDMIAVIFQCDDL